MKSLTLKFSRTLSATALLAVAALSLPMSALAKDHGKDKDKDRGKGPNKNEDRGHGHGNDPKSNHGAAVSAVAKDNARRNVAAAAEQRQTSEARADRNARIATAAVNADRREAAQNRAIVADRTDRSNARIAAERSSRNNSREYYQSRPRSTFSITLGDGYAGRGYYYGPANSPYYYEGTGVQYYRSRDLVPSNYFNDGNNNGSSNRFRGHSVSASVQRALAERGFYRGPVDGDIGPGSRRAIAHFQEEHGLRPSGEIDEPLLRALRLD